MLMEKVVKIAIFSVIVLAIIVAIVMLLKPKIEERQQYYCSEYSDCRKWEGGCVNAEWSKDKIRNLLFDGSGNCDCVNNRCGTFECSTSQDCVDWASRNKVDIPACEGGSWSCTGIGCNFNCSSHIN